MTALGSYTCSSVIKSLTFSTLNFTQSHITHALCEPINDVKALMSRLNLATNAVLPTLPLYLTSFQTRLATYFSKSDKSSEFLNIILLQFYSPARASFCLSSAAPPLCPLCTVSAPTGEKQLKTANVMKRHDYGWTST